MGGNSNKETTDRIASLKARHQEELKKLVAELENQVREETSAKVEMPLSGKAAETQVHAQGDSGAKVGLTEDEVVKQESVTYTFLTDPAILRKSEQAIRSTGSVPVAGKVLLAPKPDYPTLISFVEVLRTLNPAHHVAEVKEVKFIEVSSDNCVDARKVTFKSQDEFWNDVCLSSAMDNPYSTKEPMTVKRLLNLLEPLAMLRPNACISFSSASDHHRILNFVPIPTVKFDTNTQLWKDTSMCRFPTVIVGQSLEEIRSRLAIHPAPIERIFISDSCYEKERFFSFYDKTLQAAGKFFLDNFCVAETHGQSILRVCKMDSETLRKMLEMFSLIATPEQP